MQTHLQQCESTVVMPMKIFKTYTELSALPTFEDRFAYVQTFSKVGEDSFGSKRYLNQVLYKSKEWKKVRDDVILRDNGCDLGIEGREIAGHIHVHHINPITAEQILNRDPAIFDMDNLICCSEITHKALHYGDISSTVSDYKERTPNDTTPWKN